MGGKGNGTDAGERLTEGTKGVVPVVVRGSQTLDGRMERDHGAGHGLAGGVGVEAAVELAALGQEWA